MGGACSRYGESRGYTGFWWGNMRGKKQLGRPKRRWELNISGSS